MPALSRRAILKSIAITGLALTPFQQAVRHMRRAHAQGATIPPFPARWNGEPLGRITGEFQNARAAPSTEAEVVAELVQHEIVRVRRAVTGQLVFWHNDLWLETDRGYLYSSFVQPMDYVLPQIPQADLGTGRWAEVIVPWTDAYWDPEPSEDRLVSRQYYSSVYFVRELVTGPDGKSWYLVEELYQSYYMRATHLRIIPPEDLTPLSPEVHPSDKRLEISLADQSLIAYEGETPVFAHLVSTGLPEWETPAGLHRVHDKRPGTRMIGGAASDAESESDDTYNLPGVPFVCYFTWEWAATHGAWWHNDYGIQRSHGCVNLPPWAARWVWRWTTPTAPYDQLYWRPETGYEGTKVYVD